MRWTWCFQILREIYVRNHVDSLFIACEHHQKIITSFVPRRPHTHTHRDITILPKTQLFFLKKNCIFQKKFRKKNIFWEKNSMHDCYAAVVLRLADSGNPSRGATMMWLWKSLPWCYDAHVLHFSIKNVKNQWKCKKCNESIKM